MAARSVCEMVHPMGKAATNQPTKIGFTQVGLARPVTPTATATAASTAPQVSTPETKCMYPPIAPKITKKSPAN